MNFSSLFAPLLQQMLYPQIQKAGLWAARQSLGKTAGNAAVPALNALAGSLAQVAAAHLTHDKLAGQVGLQTTEQALTAAAGQVITGQSTLDLSRQTLLANFLSQNIVHSQSL